jgi:chorismate synthase
MKNTLAPLKITAAGESHGVGYTGIIEGLPSGLEISLDEIQTELNRRKPGGAYATPRKEDDLVEITSGYFEGKTTGAPLAFFIKNTNQRSHDYDLLKDHYRPGHADVVRDFKYPHADHRGGGHFSARITLINVVAGAFAKKLLKMHGISIQGYVSQIGPHKDSKIYTTLNTEVIEKSPLRMMDSSLDQKSQKFLQQVIEDKMSVGSEATLHITGLPVGVGTPHTQKLNALLASALFSLPAVQSVSFGQAELITQKFGHEFHDKIESIQNDKINFQSNNHGGVLGGMSSGAPIVLHTLLKPPSSFGYPQMYWNKVLQKNVELSLEGRFDPVLAPRFIPVAEAQLAIEVLNILQE